MRYFLSLLWVSSLLATMPTSAAPKKTPLRLPAESVSVFTPAKARSHLEYLASDALLGRNTPSPMLDTAAEYIAARFRSYGLQPVNGTYFHTYTLERARLGDTLELNITSGGTTTKLALKGDFIPFVRTSAADIDSAAVVFVGYGISAPQERYDDYAGIDVRGKIVVAIKGEPLTSDTARLKGPAASRYAQTSHKISAASDHGAAGIILVGDALRMRRLRPVGFAWPSLYPKIPADALPLVLPDTTPSIPAVDAGEKAITALFGSVEALRAIQSAIDSTYKPNSFVVKATTARLRIMLLSERYTIRNVMGVLPGSERPDEYVVLGAHYDHVGYFSPGAHATEMNEMENGASTPVDSIYNGADDNASGTTGLLLAAEAMQQAPIRPRRSILFLAFSGEEKGLLGSKAFVDSSPIPLSSMVAMLNMDMIGRNSSDSLSIGGNTRSPELAAWNEEANSALTKPFTLAYNIEEYFLRSDQASFALKGIPVLFYHSGEHADYHRVGDEVSKINYDKLVRCAQLCAGTAWHAAQEAIKPRYVPDNEK